MLTKERRRARGKEEEGGPATLSWLKGLANHFLCLRLTGESRVVTRKIFFYEALNQSDGIEVVVIC